VIDHLATFFSKVADVYLSVTKQTWQTNKLALRLAPYLNRKNFYAGIVLVSLLFSFFAVQLFMTPWQGTTIQGFYQVMNDPGYDAINWAQQNTPTNSVFVSDALYGWWFGGFAQRPTLSAVDPQYLTLEREFEPAKAAKNLLDTDYVIDNGLIQVREDGGYIARHNPMFLAKLNWTYFPFPFFQFNSSEIILRSRDGNTVQSTDLTQIPVTNMQLVGAETDNPSIIINKGNSDFKYSEILTVSKGVIFAIMTIVIQSNSQSVSLDWIDFFLNSQGTFQPPVGNTVAMLDAGMKECGQLIFAQNQPENVSSINKANPCITDLTYNLQGQSKAEIQILIGIYQVSETDIENQANLNKTITDNVQTAQDPVSDEKIEVFDYRQALVDWNVSYIAVRDSEIIPKFAGDPAFSLLFINDEVAVFIVK
jgi:hypothetical protein